MTPLEKIIGEIIAAEGPMPIDRYMGLCLGHPLHGYYMTRDPFGEQGDFMTAPEISQIFGELIGVWCAAAWDATGKPAQFNLVELGPGRGTLMADILKAAKVMPGFREAARIHLVEMSPILRRLQKQKLGQVTWHDTFADVPEGPLLLIANEFLDAIPLRQFEKRHGKWLERCVGAEGMGFMPAALDNAQGANGDVIEFAPQRSGIAQEIGQRLARDGGCALIIDYGHLQTAPGDTLQAVRAHEYVAVTDQPGESDITSHVDFEALAKAFRQGGAVVHPAITQRAFLLAMGLEQRAAILSSKADANSKTILDRAVARLAGETEMGNLFKVMAATSADFPVPYPFGAA
ncbi:MAG: SAM-dependent methyltransferase [Hyphomicrobiales bacterium]|nr:SAM-dependent methyltransferase [Hyphomicrobiales bacterium]